MAEFIYFRTSAREARKRGTGPGRNADRLLNLISAVGPSVPVPVMMFYLAISVR